VTALVSMRAPTWRRLIAFLASGTAISLALAGQGGARVVDLPTLYFNYAMNCTFTVTNDAGATVTSIAPGAYQIEVNTPVVFGGVYASNTTGMTGCGGSVMFQLTGPGVNDQTTLDNGDEQEDELNATLLPSSTYVAQDNNQPSVTRYVITTTATGSPVQPVQTTPAPVEAPVPAGTSEPARGSLAATVSAAGTVALTSGGKAVRSLDYGRYTIVVADRSKKAGFVLQGANDDVMVVSAVGFVGVSHVTVDLTVGRWVFDAGAGAKKTAFTVVK
jgi:hypothetical protein